MVTVTRAELENDDDFVRGYHGIPHENDLRQMSFVQLAALLPSCDKDSPKFVVVERELKKRLAEDQAKINRPNMLWAAGIGGTFALSGVALGAWLNDAPAFKQVSPPSAMQQVGNGNLGVKPPIGKPVPSTPNVTPGVPPIAQPGHHPAPVQNNAKTSGRNP